MVTTLSAFFGDMVLSSFSGSGWTSWVAPCGVPCVSEFRSLFHDIGGLQMLISLVSVLGLASVIVEKATGPREARLRHTEELYRTLIETTNDGVWIIDTEQRTIFVNHQMADMLGHKVDEIQGHPLVDFMFPGDVCPNPPDFLLHRCSQRVTNNRFRRKDGSELHARLSAGPLFARDGEFSGMMIVARDVTPLHNIEDNLRRNEKLVTAGQLAATITHEIRGALHAVANALYLLRTELTTEPGHRYLTLAEQEIQRASGIVKRTLAFFRDSSSWAEVSLSDLLDDTISFYQNTLVAHSIRVVKDYRSRGIARVSEGGMQQVFANLISNAIDAMSNGGILTVRVIDAAGKKGIRVEVEDTGRGIAEPDLKRVFDPFFTTKQNTGTGLGLWVVKEIVEKHGGEIAADSSRKSSEKCGARFSILLPRAIAQSIA